MWNSCTAQQSAKANATKIALRISPASSRGFLQLDPNNPCSNALKTPKASGECLQTCTRNQQCLQAHGTDPVILGSFKGEVYKRFCLQQPPVEHAPSANRKGTSRTSRDSRSPLLWHSRSSVPHATCFVNKRCCRFMCG